jgi:putative membrane protein
MLRRSRNLIALINVYLQRDFAREWSESLQVKRAEPLGEREIRRLVQEKKDSS